jgi:hypothetical protein
MPVLCDYCDEPAVTVSSAGSPRTRRALCQGHSARGSLVRPVALPRPENGWLRDEGRSLATLTAEVWRLNGLPVAG